MPRQRRSRHMWPANSRYVATNESWKACSFLYRVREGNHQLVHVYGQLVSAAPLTR